MAYVDLNNEDQTVLTGNDNIVIQMVEDTKRGGASLNVTDFPLPYIPAGHVVIKETSSGEYKPMPCTAAALAAVATLGSVVAGTTYTNGTYENVTLKGGTGSGAKATVVIAGTVLSTVTKTSGGEGYTVADSLTFDASQVGGTGSGASVPVASVANVAAAYSSLPASHTYEGIVIATISTKKPYVAILTHGSVNPVPMTVPIASILSAFKTAVPSIRFQQD